MILSKTPSAFDTEKQREEYLCGVEETISIAVRFAKRNPIDNYGLAKHIVMVAANQQLKILGHNCQLVKQIPSKEPPTLQYLEAIDVIRLQAISLNKRDRQIHKLNRMLNEVRGEVSPRLHLTIVKNNKTNTKSHEGK
jgi:hypothetical protein